MRRATVLMLLVAACAGQDSQGVRSYDNNDPTLAVGNGALMTCSCLFVMDMDEAYCRAWVKASPDVAKLRIDTEHKSVESSAFISWSAKAHWVDERHGCVLE
jgi:hypothetical protein